MGQPDGLITEEGPSDGPAGAVTVAEAGGVVLLCEVAVGGGGWCVAVGGLPPVAGAWEADEVDSGGGGAVAGEEGGPLGGSDVLGDVLGEVVGEALGTGVGLVAGRGCGALGRSSVWPCGHRNRPRPSPATASTEPAARRAARTRRRARTPACSRLRCAVPKGAGSWALCMSRVSCRSK
ncbi:hypothetical protein [Streptomyces sp. NPDC001851]|uniref:hypothetical protein n=1 Tax=Streptomyces sp. NPDC001851 TaxID=3154529 RepID=UPI00331AAF40